MSGSWRQHMLRNISGEAYRSVIVERSHQIPRYEYVIMNGDAGTDAPVSGIPFDPNVGADIDVLNWPAEHLRQFHDVDLLVSRESHQKLREAIVAREPVGKLALLVQEGTINIQNRVVSIFVKVARETAPDRIRRDRAEDLISAVSLLMLLIGPPLIAQTLGSWWMNTAWSPNIAGIVFLAQFVFPLVFMLLLYKTLYTYDWIAGLLMVVMGGEILALLYLGFRLRGRAPGRFIEIWPEAAVSFLLSYAFILLAVLVALKSWRTGHSAEPYAALVVEFVNLAIIAGDCSKGERTKYRLIQEIERAAQRTEYKFRELGIGGDRTLSDWSRDTGRRVAETLRRHKISVVGPAEDLAGLLRSLTNGANYASLGRLELLTTYDPPPPVRSLLRNLFPRLSLASILILVAVFGPQILPIATGSINSFRVTIFLSAAFALISPDLGRVRDTLVDIARKGR